MSEPGVEPSSQQVEALRAGLVWMDDLSSQVFRLFGYAGTGKTTLARSLVELSGRLWLYASYTGKAALVMQQLGCEGARTLHSLIYRPDDEATHVDAEGRRKVGFRLWRDSPLSRAYGVLVDEGSMIDGEVGRHILSFGKKVLVMADPGQLPPVSGGGFFTEEEPDVMLTQVHRQSAGSGILQLATWVREGGDPAEFRQDGADDCEVVSRDALSPAETWRRLLEADQIIVGTNERRHHFNARYRQLARGSRVPVDPLPVVGDKVVCKRNDREAGLLNGSMWRVEEVTRSASRPVVTMVLRDEDSGEVLPDPVTAWTGPFEGHEDWLDDRVRRRYHEFSYGYCITCHTAQGSQWRRVALYDESGVFRDRDTRRRWLYTGVTRAQERLTVIV